MCPETYDMVTNALKLGYRHIDTAWGYGNEEAVGKAIRDSSVPREEIFVTTKLTSASIISPLMRADSTARNKYHERVQEGFDESFQALNIGYIDLYVSPILVLHSVVPAGSRILMDYPNSSSTGRKPRTSRPARRFRSASHQPSPRRGSRWSRLSGHSARLSGEQAITCLHLMLQEGTF